MNSSKSRWNVYMPIVYSLILILGMQLGFKLYENLKGKPRMSVVKGGQLSELQEVLSLIDSRYVDTIDSQAFIQRLIEQALQDLDPHSNYIAADNMQEVTESLEGNFVGIGIEFSIVDDTIVVVTPVAGGPSDKLGILSGDKIVAINDTNVAGIGITNKMVLEKLRGELNSKVNVRIARFGEQRLIDYSITRQDIPLVSVDAAFMLDKEVGYIKINRFSANTYNEFMDNLIALQDKGMGKLIIDLRQNPGGYLHSAVAIADELIDGDKLLVYTEGRTYPRKEYRATARRTGKFESGQVVLLIDEGSASASEILAGAVQDWDRGTVIGRRTFGKGLVQEQYDLSSGSGLRLTIARYYTPTGRSIQKPYNYGYRHYNEELETRYTEGELTGKDSLSDLSYRTDTIAYNTLVEGRTVYGGGGISPDIFIALDTVGLDPFSLSVRRVIPEFTYHYYSNHTAVFSKYNNLQDFRNNYNIDPDLYRQFRNFVKNKLGFLDERQLLKNEHEFKNYIKSYIAKQKWNYEGFYFVSQDIDKTLQKAHEFILLQTTSSSQPNGVANHKQQGQR